MPTKIIRGFTDSAGALLLAMASALFLINLTDPAQLVQPRDPLFLISFHHMFWIAGGVSLTVALICLFHKRLTLPTYLLAWLATNYLLYRIALAYSGYQSSAVFLGSFTPAFGISPRTATAMANIVFGYLLLGSCGSIVWLWTHSVRRSNEDSLKMSCPSCGVHIEFATRNLGQKIPCPHCQAPVTLRKPGLLKMSCFFCQQHIEFPPHAIGKKIHCPHCKMDITVKEPV